MSHPLVTSIDCLPGQPTPTPALAAVPAGYRGAEITRVNKKWHPANKSADAAIAQGNTTLVARSRDQGRNDPWIKGAKRKLVRRTIGRGIGTKAAVLTDGGSADEEFNSRADKAFEHWALFEADAAGKLTWGQIQRQLLSELLEAGEVILLECANADPQRSVPLCYQVVEAEQINSSKHAPDLNDQGVRTIRGIDFDAQNRVLGYHLYTVHPYGLTAAGGAADQWVPAERVIHLYDQERPSQTRGVSFFAAIMQSARDLDWMVGAELKKAFIQSLFTVAIKRQTPGTGTGFSGVGDEEDDAQGNPLEHLGTGILADIGQSDDLEMIESKAGGGANFTSFAKLVLMQEAAGMGLSYIGFTGDYSATNFSSSRAAGNDDYDQIEIMQEDFGFRPVLLARRRFTEQALALGRFAGGRGRSVSASAFARDRERFLRATVHYPGRKQIDPDAETRAAIMRIFFGLSTWRDEAAKLGSDWRELFAQLQIEWQALDAMGMKADLNRFALAFGRAIAGQPQQGSDPPPTESDDA